MFSKSTKVSPNTKKSSLADISYRFMLDIEYKTKNLMLDLEKYKAEFTLLIQRIEKIERVIKKQETLNASDLHKEFSEIKTRIAKLNKEIEFAQKQFHKIQLKFETKLQAPFLNGAFNNQSQVVLEEVQKNIKKIQEILDLNKNSLDEIIEVGQKHTTRLIGLEAVVHQICLPNELEEATKINDKLNGRMEMICQETATLIFNASTSVSSDTSSNSAVDQDSKNITVSILRLYHAHKKGEKLLAQIQSNLHIADPILEAENKRNDCALK